MNILSNYKFSDVRNFPFPHIVLENAFSNDVYEKLACSYPIKEINDANSFKKKSNERIQISSVEMEELESLDDVWKETYQNHTSEEFYFDFLLLYQHLYLILCHIVNLIEMMDTDMILKDVNMLDGDILHPHY